MRYVDLALLPLLAGCAAGISTRVDHPIHPQQAVDMAILAVMPVRAETGSEWVRPQAMDQLVVALTARYPDMEVITPDEAADRLVAQTLADDYASLLEDFERAGVVDPSRVEQVVAAVGATHFLHVRAAYADQALERASPNFDGTQSFYSTKHQTLHVVVTLWEGSASGPVWEAVARADSERGFFEKHRRPDELLERLVLRLVEAMPLSGARTVEARH